MTTLSNRMKTMQTDRGQSLHDLIYAAALETEHLFDALKRLHRVGLDYFPAEGEAYDAMEQAIDALSKAGDKAAISANEEWAREQSRLGRFMKRIESDA